jgi:hypothetical protein
MVTVRLRHTTKVPHTEIHQKFVLGYKRSIFTIVKFWKYLKKNHKINLLSIDCTSYWTVSRQIFREYSSNCLCFCFLNCFGRVKVHFLINLTCTLNIYQVIITPVVLSHRCYSPVSNSTRFAISFNIIIWIDKLAEHRFTYSSIFARLSTVHSIAPCTTSFRDVTHRTKYGYSCDNRKNCPFKKDRRFFFLSVACFVCMCICTAQPGVKIPIQTKMKTLNAPTTPISISI